MVYLGEPAVKRGKVRHGHTEHQQGHLDANKPSSPAADDGKAQEGP